MKKFFFFFFVASFQIAIEVQSRPIYNVLV